MLTIEFQPPQESEPCNCCGGRTTRLTRFVHRDGDGNALREIGVEVSEQLDIVPQQVRVIRHERVKYACPCCDGSLRLAPKPAQVIPKGLLSDAALAWVIIAKYLDGLPLYRQAALLGRFGGTELSRNTLAASVVRVGEAVQPILNALQALPKDQRGPEQLPAKFLQRIAGLYQIEAEAREAGLDVDALTKRRQHESGPVLDDLKALLLAHVHGVLPGSLLGKALHYASSQWNKLVRYVEDGRYPIDNNACENAIRPFVVGRRNCLFSDTVAGATASANLYSLLQTCVANSIDGYSYLAALLPRLPLAASADDYEALLPWRVDLTVAR